MDDTGLNAVSTLADRVRRAAYREVASAGGAPVGRDDVAASLGIGRTLAAHHLDKLVDAGLLEVTYARRSGRTGPGAGRPAKLYRVAADAEHEVSLPPRTYRTAAELLAEAVERTGAEVALFDVARTHGRATRTPSAEVADRLEAHGYLPVEADGRIELRNCPYHRLAEQFPPLICGMSLATVEGLVEDTAWSARMDPAPGRCCVTLSKNKTD
ncbi:helix-turn-helix transcriptional regulator [Catenuloplanes japonicus]|uniref:helix-turn-helix transcriptional regulator n=1 Tax=Catenuloplanes japonicus TaxID=33876 RepID=UPI0005274923|nr:transcriptional regulator [Catenuloplanes japonicus]